MKYKSQSQRKAVMSKYSSKRSDSMSQLKKGTRVEREHSRTIRSIKNDNLSTKEAEKRIAEDHIKEDPHYYDKLQKAKL